MAIRFGRNLENPERRIEKEGEFAEPVKTVEEDDLESPYEDEFDKKLGTIESQTKPIEREGFVQSIKVEPVRTDTPLSLAYQELDRARRSRVREDIIKAEDKILDLERQEEEKGYNLRIAELKEMQKAARESGDKQQMGQFKKMRKSFIVEMDYDKLNYQIRKLQNSQRLEPSKEKLQQIEELKKELEELEISQRNR